MKPRHEKILDAYQANMKLSLKELTELIGETSEQYVSWVLNTKKRRKSPVKPTEATGLSSKLIRLHVNMPNLTTYEMAEIVDCSPSYVSTVLSRYYESKQHIKGKK